MDWYRKYFPYENGIPSNVTLGRVFAAIDVHQFNNLFIQWIRASELFEENIQVAIDGKRLRGSYDKASEKPALHVVSAFGVEAGICISQKSCDVKSNEITTIPEILDQIDKGAVISIDAMGCQKNIANKIINNESDYILAVKQNQEELDLQVQKMFMIQKPTHVDTTTNVGHGRIETRKCSVINKLDFMDVKQDWNGLKTVVMIETERIMKLTSEVETNTRYYISSLDVDANKFNKYVRNHWAIENSLHWVLDEVFKEDSSRRRKGNSPENYNIIAKMAIALLKKAKKNKESLSVMRAKAGWCSDFRETLLKFK